MSLPAIIVDIDGTLADVSAIRHYVLRARGKKDFQSFHAAASYAPPNKHVADLVRALHAQGYAILVLTSRKEQWRYRLKVWLRKWEIPFAAIGMRGDQDGRRDDIVKADLHAAVLQMGYLPVLAIDDNPIVVQLWRQLEIPTVVVPGWIRHPETDRPLAERRSS